eukprot:8761127-Pyramimonas_sp.AAC.1
MARMYSTQVRLSIFHDAVEQRSPRGSPGTPVAQRGETRGARRPEGGETTNVPKAGIFSRRTNQTKETPSSRVGRQP